MTAILKEIYRGQAQGLYAPHTFVDFMMKQGAVAVDDFEEFGQKTHIFHVEPPGVTLHYLLGGGFHRGETRDYVVIQAAGTTEKIDALETLLQRNS